MALTANDSNFNRQQGDVLEYPVKANEVIYQGATVCIKAGYAQNGANTTGFKTVGVAIDPVTGGTADGDEVVRVWRTGVFTRKSTGLTATDLGKVGYVTDNETVATSATNNITFGNIVEVVSATECRVRLSAV